MIKRPEGVGAFQFVVLAGLRAAQLRRGCTPRVDGGHKFIVTAQAEIAEGLVRQSFDCPDDPMAPAGGIGDLVIDGALAIVQPKES